MSDETRPMPMSVTGSDDASAQQLTIPSDLAAIPAAIERVLAPAWEFGYGADTVFGINLALEEALANAVKHGNKNDLSKDVHVLFGVSRDEVHISVRDEGTGFDPERVPDPTDDENIEKPCGRGIMLMRAYMDEVAYSETGNEVHMSIKAPKP